MNPRDVFLSNLFRTKAAQRDWSRRSFLRNSALGLGSFALTQLASAESTSSCSFGSGRREDESRGMIQPLHFAPRAKRIIHLCMAGGPSQIESFDPKPKLDAIHDQPFPASITEGQQLAQLQNTTLKARGSFTQYRQHGESGQVISDLFPHTAKIADRLCIVRSMHTEQINHDPAQAFMNSGSILKGRPSMGSWLTYGLGSETDNLPGFVVLLSQSNGDGNQPVSARQWSAGFLPGKYQGVQFQSRGDAVHYIGNPEGVCQSTQRLVVDEINRLNGMRAEHVYDPELSTRISQYELAFRMQTSIPELSDFSKESQAVLDAYGIKEPGDGSFASNCLMARRLAERGVRFIQLYHRGWDHHRNIESNMTRTAGETDQACRALVEDLAQRGILEDTLVIWGGEFGRTPMGQGTGRDHHILAFSIWMAGGGVNAGTTYGETDDFSYRVAHDPVSLHDLHATILKLCGIDHERFTVKFQGLDAKLTGVEKAQVIDALIG